MYFLLFLGCDEFDLFWDYLCPYAVIMDQCHGEVYEVVAMWGYVEGAL